MLLPKIFVTSPGVTDPLVTTEKGYENVLVLTDVFTKFTIATATRKKKKKKTAVTKTDGQMASCVLRTRGNSFGSGKEL